MHSWSEFLLAPTEEEAGNSSKVFYCTYHNAEAVRGAGWWIVVLMEVVLPVLTPSIASVLVIDRMESRSNRGPLVSGVASRQRVSDT
jgi:hypothetical protein